MQKRFNEYRYEAVKFFRIHQTFVVLTLFLLILVVSMLRISSLGNLEADQQYIIQKNSEIKEVKFQEGLKDKKDKRQSEKEIKNILTKQPDNLSKFL